MTEKLDRFEPKWMSPPGDTILDALAEKNWTQSEFARRAGYTAKHVSQLIKGKAAITEDTALRLERILGGSARFWLALDARHREEVARAEEIKRLESQVEWLKELPLTQMVKFGWIEKCAKKTDQVSECLKYFGVASVSVWRKEYPAPQELAAFKSSEKFEKKNGAVAAWLRRGEQIAEQRSFGKYDRKGFIKKLLGIRKLTNETDPDIFVPELINECAEVGVAVVFELAPVGCPATGATRWLAPDKALIMLSLRHKTNDHLWFAFFHEAAHILLHGKKMLFLEIEGDGNSREREADEFASNFLIPRQKADALRFLAHTKTAVRRFAEEIGVAPGIVVGRMQYEGYLPMSYLNGLKVRYEWGTGRS
ncbi:MAG: helix-turn-helix domain-containing protein [Candidatus Dadabacteria bacterium]|nr:helix-turn-helix domain-containing protein [Candidatus Dadabacteria bacterium]